MAIKYLHKKGIVHRDLKPENIMFTDSEKETIKIIDFGLSKKLTSFDEDISSNHRQSIVGTPYYVAPEVLRENYDHRCDVWSIGIIQYIMLCGYPPFNGRTSREVIQRIKKGLWSFIPEDWALISEEA